MTIISQQIAASADDAHDSGDFFPGDQTTNVTHFIGPTAADEVMYSGMRWANVNIPSGATINSCTITGYRIAFNSDGNEVVNLYVEHTKAPSGFTVGTDSPADRYGAGTGFGSATQWSMGADGGNLDPETSPDLTTPVQAALDAAGGIDHLVIVAIGDGAQLNAQAEFYAFDSGDGSDAMLLDLEYTAGGGGSDVIIGGLHRIEQGQVGLVTAAGLGGLLQ